ncbi:MAG: CoA transferase [Gammaproteobacteria bacterium]
MLSDYRVLDLTDERGALCGQLLADLGADVLRIEPTGGSPMRSSAAWSIHARNCRSCVLDVEAPENRTRHERLAGEADLVLAHGDSAGELAFANLRERYSHLVWVAITPFGAAGPKSSYAATDLIVQAAGGAMAITGFADDRPLRTGAITAWSHAGVAAACAALLALRQRDRSGCGQLVDVSAQLAVNLTASFSLLTSFISASRIRRASASTAVPLIWPAEDGFVSLSLAFAGPTLSFTRNLLGWMREVGAIDERLETLDWPAYLKALSAETGHREDFDTLLRSVGELLRTRTKEALLNEALQRRLLIVPVSSTLDLLENPQFAAREFWWETGGARQPGPFARFSATPLRLRSPAPEAGASEDAGFLPRPPREERKRVGDVADDPALPLAGVNVLDFSWVMAGPWCTRVLADYGATVVKVESSTRLDLVRILGPFYGNTVSTESSASFASINAGKLSIELDPNTPEGKAKLHELVNWADIVLESFSPKAMKKWGLDYESLRERKPDIVMLSSCLFGQTGPLADMAGYGTMGAALGGLVLPTGTPERPPCGPFGPYTDYIAPRFSALALLAALHHRDRTGHGQYIDQSQAESSMLVMSRAIAESSLGNPAPDRLANDDPTMYPHDVYPCDEDDQWVAIAVRGDGEWRALATELGRLDLADLGLAERRVAASEIQQAIAAWTRVRSAPEAEALLQRAGVPSHAVMNAELSMNDPQLAHYRHFQQTQHDRLGTVYVESTGYWFELAAPVVGKVPSLGGDSDRVLAMLDERRKPV